MRISLIKIKDFLYLGIHNKGTTTIENIGMCVLKNESAFYLLADG